MRATSQVSTISDSVGMRVPLAYFRGLAFRVVGAPLKFGEIYLKVRPRFR